MNDNATDRTERKWRSTREKFVALPLSVLYDIELSPGAVRAYCLLSDLGWRTGTAEPELAEAADMLGISKERTLRGYIRELQDKGLVSTKRRGLGRTNAYTVHPPVAPETANQNGPLGAGQERPFSSDPSRAGAAVDVDLRSVSKGRTDNTTDVLATPRKPRKRDLVFDALAEATGSDPQLESGRIVKAAKALRGHEDYKRLSRQAGRDEAEKALASEIRERAIQYRRVFDPDIALTPQALTNNWQRIMTMPERPLTPEEIAAGAYRDA